LLKLRAYSDEICKQYGLTTLQPYLGGESKSLGSREYRAAARGESWKFSIMNAIDDCMKHAPTKKAFIEMMERNGYAVKWTDTRKSITYTCPNTMSCRDIKLHDPRYLKEKMEREFELRRIETEKLRLAAREGTPEQPLQPSNYLLPTEDWTAMQQQIQSLQQQLHSLKTQNESLCTRLSQMSTKTGRITGTKGKGDKGGGTQYTVNRAFD